MYCTVFRRNLTKFLFNQLLKYQVYFLGFIMLVRIKIISCCIRAQNSSAVLNRVVSSSWAAPRTGSRYSSRTWVMRSSNMGPASWNWAWDICSLQIKKVKGVKTSGRKFTTLENLNLKPVEFWKWKRHTLQAVQGDEGHKLARGPRWRCRGRVGCC